jgi:hypothetical protein
MVYHTYRLYRFLGYKSICTTMFAEKLVFIGAPCVKKLAWQRVKHHTPGNNPKDYMQHDKS